MIRATASGKFTVFILERNVSYSVISGGHSSYKYKSLIKIKSNEKACKRLFLFIAFDIEN